MDTTKNSPKSHTPPVPAPPVPGAIAGRARVEAAFAVGEAASADDPSARAVEVAAMLGDSVVAVSHLTDPHGGRVTRTTKLLFAGGVLGLLLAAIAIAHGIVVASHNQAAYARWVDVERRAADDFRPVRMAVGWDLMAILGVGGGLLLLAWGTARLLEERRPATFRIGEGDDAEFPVAGAGLDAFPLVAPDGDGFAFSWAPGMRGSRIVGDEVTPLEATPARQPIVPGTRFQVELGENTFLVASVAAPRRTPVGLLSSAATPILAFLVGSAAAHFLLLSLLYAVVPDKKTLTLDSMPGADHLVNAHLKPTEEPVVTDLSDTKAADEDRGSSAGMKQALAEGKMGSKESKRVSGRYQLEDRGVDPRLARQSAQDSARTAGILGGLRVERGSAFRSLTGTDDFASGLDERTTYGGLIGDEPGEMGGDWGYGVQGYGPGGGGTGLGTIGSRRYGLIGHDGPGTGKRYATGRIGGSGTRRTASVPQPRLGVAYTVGELDKSIIRRYVRDRLGLITHCYERQLVVKPQLAGTVTTRFTISGTGSVIAAQAGGIGDATVEACVAGVIQNIQFPRPTGGGVVNVVYPFTFRPAGE